MNFIRKIPAHLCIWLALTGLWLLMRHGFGPAEKFFFSGIGFFSWGSALQLGTNTFFPWRDDMLGALVGRIPLLSDAWRAWDLAGLLRAMLFSSMILSLSPKDTRAAAFEALALPALLAVLFGFNSPYMQALAFSPVLLLALRLLGGKNPDLAASGLFFASALVSLGANQLGLPIVICAVFASDAWGGLSRNDKFASALLALLPALAAAIWAPAPSIPAYPWDAHVVPASGAPFAFYPMLGSQSPIPLVNRSFEKSFYLLASLAVTAWSLIEILRAKNISAALWVALFLSASLCLDSLLPEGLSLIMPLQTAARVLPGAFFIPVPGAALAIIFFILLSSAHSLLSGWSRLLFLAAAVYGPLAAPSQISFVEVSPSNYLLSREAPVDRGRIKLAQDADLKGLMELGASVSASPLKPESPAAAVMDGDYNTRWSSMTGGQAGGEILKIRFKKPEPLDLVEISPGDFETDFPRGVRLSCSDSCGESGATAAPREIYKTTSWEGALGLSKDGYPCYLPQKNVRILLARTEFCGCLLIEQIGQTDKFDWSVAEIKASAFASVTNVPR